MNVSAYLMQEHINKAQFLGNDYRLEMVTKDTHCSAHYGQIEATEVLLLPAEERPFGVVGCGCSGCTANIARTLNTARIPLISQSATSAELSIRDSFPSMFRLFQPDNQALASWFTLYRSLG